MAKKKVTSDLSDYFEYGIDVAHRVIYMGSVSYTFDDSETGVDHLMAEKVIKSLTVLDLQAPEGDKPITIIMNNPGGDVYHGMAIYDAIKSCKNEVNIIVYGHATSMGAIILQAADKRILAPNCVVMVHDGTDGYSDHTQNVLRRAKEAKRIIKMIDEIFYNRMVKKNPKITRKDVRNMQLFDTWFSAKDAIAKGLADAILSVKP